MSRHVWFLEVWAWQGVSRVLIHWRRQSFRYSSDSSDMAWFVFVVVMVVVVLQNWGVEGEGWNGMAWTSCVFSPGSDSGIGGSCFGMSGCYMWVRNGEKVEDVVLFCFFWGFLAAVKDIMVWSAGFAALIAPCFRMAWCKMPLPWKMSFFWDIPEPKRCQNLWGWRGVFFFRGGFAYRLPDGWPEIWCNTWQWCVTRALLTVGSWMHEVQIC